MRPGRVLTSPLAVVLLVLSPPVSAAPGGSPYRTRAAVDVPVTGLGLALSLSALVEMPPPACLPDCDPGEVNALDRAVIGNWSPSARLGADITVTTLLTLPLLVDALDSGGDGFLDDTAVYAETLAVAFGLNQIVKLAVGRTAPFVYNPDVPEDMRYGSDSATRSFFSGHATMAFAAAAATSVTFWQRHPRSPWRWVVIAVTGALATTTALLKIEAGYHFWTDITAGALVGTSIGVLVPVLHFR